MFIFETFGSISGIEWILLFGIYTKRVIHSKEYQTQDDKIGINFIEDVKLHE